MFQIRNVSIALGEKPVVENMSFEIETSEVVGLIGPNGVGKSTLIKAMTKLLPYLGEMEFLDKQINDFNPRKLSQSLSYLPQQAPIHWPLSVENTVALGRLPFLSPLQELGKEDRSAMNEAMQLAEISHLRGRTVTQLSGGEKSLVMLARALASRPKLLLADEPVAGLDPGHQIQVMEILRRLAGENRSVLVVLHDLTLAARFCDKVVLMSEGSLLAQGKPQEVLTGENLEKAYGVRVKISRESDEFYLIPWERLH